MYIYIIIIHSTHTQTRAIALINNDEYAIRKNKKKNTRRHINYVRVVLRHCYSENS